MGSGFRVGPSKPEFLHRAIVLRCPKHRYCKKPGARVSFGGEQPRILSGASWPDPRLPSLPPFPSPTPTPLLSWAQAPAPSSQHLGLNQASFGKYRCPFPATSKALLKASLFETGQVKLKPRPGLLNYQVHAPAPSWPFKPPCPPPAQSAGREPGCEGENGVQGLPGRVWGNCQALEIEGRERAVLQGSPGDLRCPNLTGDGGQGWSLRPGLREADRA